MKILNLELQNILLLIKIKYGHKDCLMLEKLGYELYIEKNKAKEIYNLNCR